jgi:hypothetical protein
VVIHKKRVPIKEKIKTINRITKKNTYMSEVIGVNSVENFDEEFVINNTNIAESMNILANQRLTIM